MKALRPLLLLLSLLVLSGQALATAHAHEADEPVVCDACTLSERMDEGAPVPDVPDALVPLPGVVAQAFALDAAIVPTVTAHPPGRAPPLPR